MLSGEGSQHEDELLALRGGHVVFIYFVEGVIPQSEINCPFPNQAEQSELCTFGS